MLVEEVVKLSPLDRFVYWVRERHQIYLKRMAGLPRPWTDDRILQTVFFTNPYRENDRVTTWYRKNIREPYADNAGVVFATIVFRWFNWPMTGNILLGVKSATGPKERFGLLQDWDTKSAVDYLTAVKESGNQIFSGAYNISNSGSTKPKINRVCEDYIAPIWEDRENLRAFAIDSIMNSRFTLERFHKFLSKYPGLKGSGFMAAQIVADLKYTVFFRHATDWWTWCSPGPGSIKGLNILLGRPVDSSAPKNFLEEVNKLRVVLGERLPKMPYFHAQDVQNCCCEFFKYTRALEGGKSKRTYQGV